MKKEANICPSLNNKSSTHTSITLLLTLVPRRRVLGRRLLLLDDPLVWVVEVHDDNGQLPVAVLHGADGHVAQEALACTKGLVSVGVWKRLIAVI